MQDDGDASSSPVSQPPSYRATATAAAAAAPPAQLNAAPAVNVTSWTLPSATSTTAKLPTPSSSPAMQSTLGIPTKKWNTNRLSARVGADAIAAASAGALVAPLITIIDRGIIENASGRQQLSQSIRTSLATLLRRPHQFLLSKPFALVFALYCGTYFTANTVDTLHSTTHGRPATTTTAGTTKFALTSTANLSLCLFKDSQFTRMFGPVTKSPTGAVIAAARRSVPPASYALFAARDAITVFASFNLPPLLAPILPVSDAVERYMSRASVAQFLAPAAMQVFSTPLHLLGLDLYNRNGSTTFSMRLQKVWQDWGKSCLARMARIVPAFGVGGVVNNRIRKNLMLALEDEQVQEEIESA